MFDFQAERTICKDPQSHPGRKNGFESQASVVVELLIKCHLCVYYTLNTPLSYLHPPHSVICCAILDTFTSGYIHMYHIHTHMCDFIYLYEIHDTQMRENIFVFLGLA